MLSYMAIGMGDCREKVRSLMIEVCVSMVLQLWRSGLEAMEGAEER
jgi:hypothetical protein